MRRRAQLSPTTASSLLHTYNPTRPLRPSPLTISPLPSMPLDMVDRIRTFPLFNLASESFLLAIGQHLKPSVHAAADVIITEGDEARGMYWVVRGVVAVVSRDGEAVFAELGAGCFFGEIGVLMDIPRTATIIARSKCLLLSLKKEDLMVELPKFPEMEKRIREEAQERLNILRKKREERIAAKKQRDPGGTVNGSANPKKRKSPSPGLAEDPSAGASALGSATVSIRDTLRELPLFSGLSDDILHFLGLNVQPKRYPPFTDIVLKGTPGNEIYFIVNGEAEVLIDAMIPPRRFSYAGSDDSGPRPDVSMLKRPRLHSGQYFGEVASLGLAHKRTATVKAITTVECLVIPGPTLEELWSRTDIREQVEETAKQRYPVSGGNDQDGDVIMTMEEGSTATDSSVHEQFASFTFGASTSGTSLKSKTSASSLSSTGSSGSTRKHDLPEIKSTPDPDPFLSVDMENMRNRRKGSIAPPTPPADSPTGLVKSVHPLAVNSMSASATLPLGTLSASGLSSPADYQTHTGLQRAPSMPVVPIYSPPPDVEETPKKRIRIHPRRRSSADQVIPEAVLEMVLATFPIADIFKLRLVSPHWKRLLATSPALCHNVDLTPHNRIITDSLLQRTITPFLGQRPRLIDISNCFHVTDAGFSALHKHCACHVRIFRMRSVWDVSANSILELSEQARDLEEIDWSNCRKIGDNLLARVTGWVVPEDHRPASANGNGKRKAVVVAPGTVIGCPKLRRLNLSYCKHVTDRSMAHLALHASNRLEELVLTRCTTISDAGFHSWAAFRFEKLRNLCLADCTYLTDHAITSLVTAAKGLRILDLSFCCALSDSSTEMVALGLPELRELRLAFCGSAVSDGSLGCVALHLSKLRGISVRGCVRVTGAGVEALLEGCPKLKWLDGSQCRNLEPWVRAGGVKRWGHDEHGGDGLNGGEIVPEERVEIERGPRLFVGREVGRRREEMMKKRGDVKFILTKSMEGLR